jgi:2-oxoglutarate ferredoxin oxidoreductase subunit gamma
MIIRLVGFGGQGIVLSSYILGQAAVFDGKKALQNQSYGSESRGGECRGDVIISDDEIFDLEPEKYDVLIAMAQPGYDKFISCLKPGGILITDRDLVIADGKDEPSNIIKHAVGATDTASTKFGQKVVANMIILGYLNAISGLVSQEALSRAVKENVPEGTKELNIRAVREGISLAGRVSKGGEDE